MIVKKLIDICSDFNVAKVIAYWAKVDEKDFSDLLQRCTKLLDELRKTDDYWVCDDENFCFVGYIDNDENIPEVILTSDASKLEDAGWKKTNDISSYDWSWNDFLGLTVYNRSIEKYGADALLGKILYRITYYDYLEDEVREIRITLENENNINQVDLYHKLIKRICGIGLTEKILNNLQ